MKSPLLFAAALIAVFPLGVRAADAPIPPEIENEQILGINKEPWHATLMPYGSLGEALGGLRQKSSFARSLNGTWKFHWVKRPEQRPIAFYRPDFDVSKWETIAVPSCWQIKGYGTPYYRNNGYTFQKDWPRVMTEPPKNFTAYDERNPVGSYRRDFSVPANWTGRRVFLTFDGVDSAFYLWINGKRVGYSPNSRNPAEFDVTPYIRRDAANTVAVEVYTYCSGSYLEDQDMWRLSGIFRNVTLWSAPQQHIRDFTVKTDLDGQYQNATLAVSAKVKNYAASPAKARTLTVSLFDRKSAKAVSGAVGRASVPALAPGQEAVVRVSIPVKAPRKWTAETPNLYTTVLALQDGTAVAERISTPTGFREVEIKGRLFLVNGVPIKLKGANRHENEPETGHTVSEAEMIRDIKILKQANCNHVRTSHYTDDPRWYELCDEYGLYLVAEANIECHGYMGVLDREPRYEKMFVDRNIANVENLKNHASIIIWSLGNECGPGSNLASALKAIRAIDTSRPSHYEGFGIGGRNPADIDSNMYAGVAGVERNATDPRLTKPYYLCEYAHAMFNSMGSLGDYNDVFDKYPSLLGGAIWEWQDQGIWNRRNPARTYLAYGGGFGEVPNDFYFIHKGVIFSDRTPKPHYPEVKRAYQWVGFAPENLAEGRVRIKNKFAFTNLSRFQPAWTLTEDGVRIQGGTLAPISLAPGKEGMMSVPLKPFAPKSGAVYHINVSMALRSPESWAPAGHEIANDQFPLPAAAVTAMAAASSPSPASLALAESPERLTVTGANFNVAFDKKTGAITELRQAGTNLLLPGGGPKLHLWRAVHQQDDNYAARDWQSAGLRSLVQKLLTLQATKVGTDAVRVAASIQYTGNDFGVVHNAVYTVYGDGRIVVDNTVAPEGRRINLARIGVRLMLDKRMDALRYLARGPMENYSDRKRGSDIGLYASSVAGQLTPYSKPMEAGNHEDARWLALSGKGTPMLLATAAGSDPMQFSALPHSDEELETAPYRVDLPMSRATVVCLSAKTLGVGSNSCGPTPLPQYRVFSEPNAFSYVLRLLPAGTSDPASLARQALPANRPLPVLATRDAGGRVALTTAGGAAVNQEYSLDGRQWTAYTEPLAITRTTLLRVRSRTPDGQTIESSFPFAAQTDRSKWTVTVSSFEGGEGNANHLIDGDPTTFWHSRWSGTAAPAPHSVVLNLSEVKELTGLRMTPRIDMSNGRVREYELYLSTDGTTWGSPAIKGTLRNVPDRQTLALPAPQKAQYIKIVVLSDHSGQNLGAIGEIDVVEAEAR
ncbi:MAG: glycoside hydrolase family 2 TIM barrel-domain containing protein [Armatimonadota bacterium]